MEKRQLGASDLMLSPVTLGAWAIGGSMWGGQEESEAIATIQAALDAGVNCIDTAPVYGRGRSEEIVGKALRGRRDGVIVATKCGLAWDVPDGTFKFQYTEVDGSAHRVLYDLRPARIRAECEDSLKRLGIDVIDLYQIHWPDPERPVDEAVVELVKLRTEGKIRWIGVSNFSQEQHETAHAAARAAGGIVSTQPAYNLIERDIEATLLPWCRAQGVGVIPYSPLARGLLTGKYGADHVFPPSDHRNGVRWFQPAVRDKALAALEKARGMASAYGVSLGNLALAWVLHTPGITSAITGARTPAQALENMRALHVRLSGEDYAQLGAWFSGG